MGRKKLNAREVDEQEQKEKLEAISSSNRSLMYTCHKCGKNFPMIGIIGIQNDGPLCYKCGGKEI